MKAAAFFFVLLVWGCGRNTVTETPSPERLFTEAQQAAEAGGIFGSRDCFSAEKKVQELRRRYPYHAATLEGELILAECAHGDGRTMEAIGRWEAFLRFHREHRRAPEVWLQLALAYQSQYDDYDRDLGTVKQSLYAATTLIREYPTETTAHQAVDIRRWAREILAEYEYYVAKKYRRSRDLLSAKGRLENLIQLYPETRVIPEAKEDLVRLEARLDFPKKLNDPNEPDKKSDEKK